MLTGKLLTGVEAKEWGLVNDVAPADELDECVDRFVADSRRQEPLPDVDHEDEASTAASMRTPRR